MQEPASNFKPFRSLEGILQLLCLKIIPFLSIKDQNRLMSTSRSEMYDPVQNYLFSRAVWAHHCPPRIAYLHLEGNADEDGNPIYPVLQVRPFQFAKRDCTGTTFQTELRLYNMVWKEKVNSRLKITKKRFRETIQVGFTLSRVIQGQVQILVKKPCFLDTCRHGRSMQLCNCGEVCIYDSDYPLCFFQPDGLDCHRIKVYQDCLENCALHFHDDLSAEQAKSYPSLDFLLSRLPVGAAAARHFHDDPSAEQAKSYPSLDLFLSRATVKKDFPKYAPSDDSEVVVPQIFYHSALTQQEWKRYLPRPGHGDNGLEYSLEELPWYARVNNGNDGNGNDGFWFNNSEDDNHEDGQDDNHNHDHDVDHENNDDGHGSEDERSNGDHDDDVSEDE